MTNMNQLDSQIGGMGRNEPFQHVYFPMWLIRNALQRGCTRHEYVRENWRTLSLLEKE